MATILSSGQITITDITDGISTLNAILSNESHTLPASNAGVVSSYVGSGTDIITYEGATALTYVTSAPTAGKYMVSASSNITVGALSGNNTTVCAVASHSELADATDTATITYTITGVTSAGTNFTITKTQTLSKAKAGSSITGVVNSYLASASSTGVTTATPGWTTTVQTPTASLPYLWNYETVSYSNSTSIDTTPCIIGNYASNGTPGTVITYEYYLSTSASSATGGSWSATVPAVTAGTYMWLRVLTNGTAGTAYRVTGEKGADSTTPGPGVPYIRTYASQLDNNASPSIRVGGTNYGSYSRGHTLVTIVPSTGVITPYTTIDTYASDANSTALATTINGLAVGTIVILTTYDASGCNQSLRTALVDCGSSSSQTWTSTRIAHAFIGQKGAIVGTAYESISSGSQAPSLQVAYYTIDGLISNSFTASSTVLAYCVLSNTGLPASPSITQGTVPTIGSAVTGGTWYTSPKTTLGADEWMFQVSGTKSSSGTYVWETQGYLSTFKVGSLSAISANLGSIQLDATGSLYSKAYGAANGGVFLGYNIDNYKLDVGKDTAYLRWTGTGLDVRGATIRNSSGTIVLDTNTTPASIQNSNITINAATGAIENIGTGAGTIINNAAIVVGGRNLLANSFNYFPYISSGSDGGAPVTTNTTNAPDGQPYITCTLTANAASMNVYFWLVRTLPANTSVGYTLSFKYKASHAGYFFYRTDHPTANVTLNVAPTAVWTDAKITVAQLITGTGTQLFGFIWDSFVSGAYVQIKLLKVELGNKATDWSPAPEDVAADINTAATTGATNGAAAAANNPALQNSSISLTATGQLVGANSGSAAIDIAQLAGKITAAQVTAGSITTNKLAIVPAIGSNIWADSGFKDITAWTQCNWGEFPTSSNIGDGARGDYCATGYAGGASAYGTVRIPVIPGKQYRVSCVARKSPDANGTLYFRLNPSNAQTGGYVEAYIGIENISTPTTWTQYVGIWTANTFYVSPMILLNYASSAGWMQAQGMCIEEVISADLIVDGAITASKISADAITGKNVKITSTGNFSSEGKTGYGDTVSGVFLGYSGGAYKFEVGNPTNHLRWSGSALSIASPQFSLTEAGTATFSGSIIGSNIKTAASNARVELNTLGNSNSLCVYSADNLPRVALGMTNSVYEGSLLAVIAAGTDKTAAVLQGSNTYNALATLRIRPPIDFANSLTWGDNAPGLYGAIEIYPTTGDPTQASRAGNLAFVVDHLKAHDGSGWKTLAYTSDNVASALTSNAVAIHAGNEVNVGGGYIGSTLYFNWNDGGLYETLRFCNGSTGLSNIAVAGVTLGNTANASTTVLDWYEEGSFTADTLDLITQATATVYWTRIGKTVHMCVENPSYYAAASNVSTSVYNRLNFSTNMPTHLRPSTWTQGCYGTFYNGTARGQCDWYLNKTGYLYFLINGDAAAWTPSSIRGAGGTRSNFSYLLV